MIRGNAKPRRLIMSRSIDSEPHYSLLNATTPRPLLVDVPLSTELTPLPATQLRLHLFRMQEGRRMSVGSDEMSISSGPTVSDMPSTPSVTACPKCCTCKKSEATDHNPLIRCACRRHYHAACHKPVISIDQQRYSFHKQTQIFDY